MMGISNQDLVFKLKSIGVRVEGDDAHIDTDIVQAILQGKKLPHPREVILRDEQTPNAVDPARRRTAAAPPPPTAARRPPPSPLGPRRPRTLIQKVEPRIQTLPMSERPHVMAEPASALAEALPAQHAEMAQPEVLASSGGGVATAAPVEAPPSHVAEARRRPSSARPPRRRPGRLVRRPRRPAPAFRREVRREAAPEVLAALPAPGPATPPPAVPAPAGPEGSSAPAVPAAVSARAPACSSRPAPVRAPACSSAPAVRLPAGPI